MNDGFEINTRKLIYEIRLSILCVSEAVLPSVKQNLTQTKLLLLHLSQFSKSVRSPNSTKVTSQKCTEKTTHTSSQQNAA